MYGSQHPNALEGEERSLKIRDSGKLECNERQLKVQVDGHLLENALLELVQNSREAAVNPEDMRISVAIESIQLNSQDWVRIVYKDNGPGVPNDLKERIFENFFSFRPGRKIETGLGLGFVRRVVEAHSGIIQEKGQLGQGVEFVIEVPKFMTAAKTKEEEHVSNSDC